MILSYHNQQYECEKAVRDSDHENVWIYDSEGNVIREFHNIIPREWKVISLQNGEWSAPDYVPTELDCLRADVDYLLMLDE